MTPYNFVDAPTAVFWDTNCCPVPADLHFIHVLRNIKRCLYESSYNGVVCYNTLLCVRDSLTAFPTTGGRPFITRDFSFVSSVWSWFELSHGRPPFFNRFSDKPSVPLAFLKKKKRSPRQRKVLVDPVKSEDRLSSTCFLIG
ncbi:PREDICTED: uncharacterized protein LOC106293444 isoform X2 [Brassica oleracea var. oleracea]|uniref:uncharacterized protein LOC106293444 isoform X2 n=1 Tax=Brassica oleracea var. oleracea TaxID=109376 RepID=UPI0006A75432|nr:PREDICTED: uncharacterized protein LOC106293444 isoform X2 [Brassica oleracea var. oleracea]